MTRQQTVSFRPAGGRPISWPLATLTVALLVAAACGRGADAGSPGGPPGGPGGGMPVEIIELKPQPIEDRAEFVGMLKSRRSSAIQPQVEGFIRQILVRSGDQVQVGAPLFEIDNSPQQAAVASLESVRAAREADASYARQQLERAQKLLAVGAGTQQELDQAANTAKTAEAQLEAVAAQIRQEQAQLAYYQVVAPTAGVVGDIPVRVGDRVTSSTTLTTIDDNSGLEIYVNVPVQQSAKLRRGLSVRLVDEAGNTLATERIDFVAATVDEATQTVLAKAPLTQRGGQFRSDQFVRARLVFSSEPALVIPVTSVLRISGQFFAYVAEPVDGGLVARQRNVTVGQVVGQNYVVQGGLREGERVIVSGIQMIGDGAPVQAAPPAPSGAAPGAPAGGGR